MLLNKTVNVKAPENDIAAVSVAASARVLDYTQAGAQIMRPVAVETAVNVVYGPVPFAVMMATPNDLEDFAYGFSFTEGVIQHPSDIVGVEIKGEQRGLRLEIALRGNKMQAHLARKRALSGRTGCGLCGIEDLDSLPNATVRFKPDFKLTPSAVGKALRAFAAHQPLNDETRAVHAAAFADLSGNIIAVREDVGRHNALDKLIGALLRIGRNAEDGFIVITSRCSFEMVEKAAIFGARALVAISAPTSLALERAQAHGMILVALARDDYALIFQGCDAFDTKKLALAK